MSITLDEAQELSEYLRMNHWKSIDWDETQEGQWYWLVDIPGDYFDMIVQRRGCYLCDSRVKFLKGEIMRFQSQGARILAVPKPIKR